MENKNNNGIFLEALKKTIKEGRHATAEDLKEHGVGLKDACKYLESENIPYTIRDGNILPAASPVKKKQPSKAKPKTRRTKITKPIILAMLILFVVGIIYYAIDDKKGNLNSEKVIRSKVSAIVSGVTMAQVKNEIADRLSPIGETISQLTTKVSQLITNTNSRISQVEEKINNLTNSVNVLEEATKATEAQVNSQLPVGKILELHEKAFVTEEGVNPKYWSVTFRGKNVNGNEINNLKLHEEYAKDIKEHGKDVADEKLREKVSDKDGYEYKFMVCNMNAERKKIFLKNINTVLFKINFQSHWAWDNKLNAFVTSDPDGISPIIISDFNMQTKSKKKRADRRSSTLKSEFEN